MIICSTSCGQLMQQDLTWIPSKWTVYDINLEFLLPLSSAAVPNVGWWILGGASIFNPDDPDFKVSKVYLTDSGKWIDGPILEHETHGHCMVQMSDSETLIVASDHTYLYNWETQESQAHDDVIIDRKNMGCGLDPITNLVVIAGGYNEQTYTITKINQII